MTGEHVNAEISNKNTELFSQHLLGDRRNTSDRPAQHRERRARSRATARSRRMPLLALLESLPAPANQETESRGRIRGEE